MHTVKHKLFADNKKLEIPISSDIRIIECEICGSKVQRRNYDTHLLSAKHRKVAEVIASIKHK